MGKRKAAVPLMPRQADEILRHLQQASDLWGGKDDEEIDLASASEIKDAMDKAIALMREKMQLPEVRHGLLDFQSDELFTHLEICILHHRYAHSQGKDEHHAPQHYIHGIPWRKSP
jgi:hypothetical protein